MPNMTSTGQQPASTIMPFISGPSANVGPSAQPQAPMLGSNVQVSQPQPPRPTSIPEAVMMKALMRRMGGM